MNPDDTTNDNVYDRDLEGDKLADLLKQARIASAAGDDATADALYAQIAAIEGSVQ